MGLQETTGLSFSGRGSGTAFVVSLAVRDGGGALIAGVWQPKVKRRMKSR
jgi:hypothetical protein